MIGVTTTEVLAAQANRQGPVLVAIDTKRGDFYAQHFDGTRALGEIAVISAAAVASAPNTLVVQGGENANLLPDPAVLARLASERAPVAGGPLPVYARAPDAVVPQHGGRLRP